MFALLPLLLSLVACDEGGGNGRSANRWSTTSGDCGGDGAPVIVTDNELDGAEIYSVEAGNDNGWYNVVNGHAGAVLYRADDGLHLACPDGTQEWLAHWIEG